MSRRDFLKMAALVGGAAAGTGLTIEAARGFRDVQTVLTLGGAPVLGGEAEGVAAIQIRTATPRPEGTPTHTVDPTETSPYETVLAQEARAYATSMGYSEAEVLARAAVTSQVDRFDEEFQVAVDRQTSIPLLITTESKQWQRASLKALADRARMTVGVQLEYNTQVSLLKNEFNYGLITSGWGWSTQPDSRGAIRFNYEDGLIRLSQEQGIDSFRLMHLLFPASGTVPEWLKKETFSRKDLTGIVTNYITTVMNHFRGIVQEYVVVNEPYRAEDLFLRVMGPEYVDIAFQAAREANPRASLVFNETDNHRSNGYSTSWTRETVGRLKSKGLIDKVGLQMHLERDVIGDPGDVTKTIQDYGLPASVTEFDYDIRHLAGTRGDRFAKQAQVYESVLGAAVAAGVRDLGFWGTYDEMSWREQPEFNGSPDADPTMWDDQGKPKPAYYAVRKVLLDALRPAG